MKRVILLGSTGSIGRNTIEVIKTLKEFKIVGLAAYTNHKLLEEQAKHYRPEAITIIDKDYYKSLRRNLRGINILYGEPGITKMMQMVDADILVGALASSLGIFGILKAIEKGMRICLATKEILVSFGEIIMQGTKKSGAKLIPIDSEHSAIYQCLEGKKISEVLNIILTASGGPFLNRKIKNVKKTDVLKHPVWKMGRKITVDSATMMNKGLEVIEAHHLFGLPLEKIKVAIHPEALCHSLVQFIDGSIICHLSTPDMRLPIQYALTAPDRLPSKIKYLDINKVKSLNFFSPDFKKFPCLGLAYEALKVGKSMPAVLNGANAEAVKLFLEDKIEFNEIPAIINKTMTNHTPKKGNIKDYLEAEKWAREFVEKKNGERLKKAIKAERRLT